MLLLSGKQRRSKQHLINNSRNSTYVDGNNQRPIIWLAVGISRCLGFTVYPLLLLPVHRQLPADSMGVGAAWSDAQDVL